MAHYYIKKAYSSLLVSPNMNYERNTLEIYLLTDMLDQSKITDTVLINIYKYVNGFKSLYEKKIDFEISSFKSILLKEISFNEIENATNCSRSSQINDNCIITFQLASQNPLLKDGENFIFYNNSFKQVNNVVDIIDIQKINSNEFLIKLSASQISLFVWLDIESSNIIGYFSENGFHMTQDSKNIEFYSINENLNENILRKYLNVISISPF